MSRIAYCRKKSQTSPECEAAVNAALDINHEVTAAAASVPKRLARSKKASWWETRESIRENLAVATAELEFVREDMEAQEKRAAHQGKRAEN